MSRGDGARGRGEERSLWTFLDRLPQGVAQTDRQGIVIEVNEALCALLGREAQALRGVPLWDVLGPSLRPLAEGIAADLDGGASDLPKPLWTNVDVPGRGPTALRIDRLGPGSDDAANPTVWWVFTVESNPAGEACRLAEVLADRTGELLQMRRRLEVETGRRRRAEQHLKRSDEVLRRQAFTLRTVLDTVPTRVFWKDQSRRYVGCNVQFARDAGLSSTEDVIGLDDGQLPWKDDAEVLRACDQSVLTTGRPVISVERSLRLADGRRHWLSTTCVPLRDRSGEITGILGTYEDITPQKDLMARMIRQQRDESIATLAGGIAHDFNNILVGILGSAELLERRFEGDAGAAQLIETMTLGARRMADLTTQLLTYARGDAWDPRPLGVAQLVREALTLARGHLGPAVEVDVHFEEGMPPVLAEPAQLTQVFLNLVVNACEAMGNEGRLTIRGSRRQIGAGHFCDATHRALAPGTYVAIQVTDSGPGIPELVKDRIFEPFFSTKFTGRGLGLAAVLGVVRTHRGGIFVGPSPAGRGTAFDVLLPAAVEAMRRQVPDAHARGGEGDGLRVLIVDDDAFVRRILARMLETLGHSPLEAAGPGQALATVAAAAAETPVDLVVLDLQLARADGLTLLEELRRQESDLPVVIYSGHDDLVRRVSKRRDLVDGVALLRKPASLEQLRQAMDVAISRAGGSGEVSRAE